MMGDEGLQVMVMVMVMMMMMVMVMVMVIWRVTCDAGALPAVGAKFNGDHRHM